MPVVEVNVVNSSWSMCKALSSSLELTLLSVVAITPCGANHWIFTSFVFSYFLPHGQRPRQSHNNLSTVADTKEEPLLVYVVHVLRLELVFS